MKPVQIRRPQPNDVLELKAFFSLVLIDTFEKNGIGHLTADRDEELESKYHALHSDFESNGKERFFLIATN
ncbi:hypothetical protein [Ornithinibacillus contaminans]|uniref:hypothetical protein n=1 Tax=Ornithinibacillus contaminans TaxID=694055 RepID=UPI0038B3BC5F